MGSGFEPHWRPQPAKLPSFGGYSLETLPYLTWPQDAGRHRFRHAKGYMHKLPCGRTTEQHLVHSLIAAGQGPGTAFFSNLSFLNALSSWWRNSAWALCLLLKQRSCICC